MNDLQQIFDTLRSISRKYQPPLQPKNDKDDYFDLWSFKELVIAGRKRKEIFFTALIIQKNYVGFYFMPVYVENDLKALFPAELLQLLKGKSCFHIKSLTPELTRQIDWVLEKGFQLYQERGWV